VTRRVNDAWAALRAWAAGAAGVAIDDAPFDQLRAYVEVLQHWNARMALVSQREVEAILVKHVADSIFAAGRCGDAARIADLGSGAGFPAVPIAILRPGTQVCCFEATAKKVSFLAAARVATGLRNLLVREGRIETAATDAAHRESYDLATSRALADLEPLRRLATPLLRPGGRLLAMRAAGLAVPAGAEVIEYRLPDGTPRELVMLGQAAVKVSVDGRSQVQ